MILFLLALTSVAIALGIIMVAGYYQDKNNRVRYAPISHRMKPGVRYPYWRLEEMLQEERDNK